jgi:hypothetical protein
MLTRLRYLVPILAIVALFYSVAVSQTANVKAYSGVAKALSQLTTDPIVLLKPGRFLDPSYDHLDPQKRYMDALQFNRMLKPLLIYSESSNDLANLYAAVLTDEQWASVPLLPLQVVERVRLREFLYNNDGTPKVGYQRYREKKKAWLETDELYEKTPDNERTPQLEARHQQALDEFDLLRPRYEPSENRYEQLNEQSSLKWRDADIERLAAFRSISTAGSPFLLTTTSPALDDAEAFNWIRIQITASQLLQTSPLPKFTNGLDSNALRWWHWANPADVDVNSCAEALDNADFIIQFEVALAKIERDWFDEKVFESQAWRWKSGATDLISDGEDDENRGLSPVILRSVVVVRSVTISGPSVIPCLPFVRKAVSAQNAIAFGPFQIAGGIGQPSSFYLPPIITQKSIRVVYPQILGYGVSVLPKTPNPNPGYTWSVN